MIIQIAASGANADEIGRRVDALTLHWSKELNGEWKHDRAEWPHLEGIEGACKGCAWRVMQDRKHYCLRTICFEAKRKQVEREYLEQASAACGLPILEGKERSEVSGFSYDETKRRVAEEAHCENLRVVYVTPNSCDRPGDKPNRVSGFQRAEIVCQKRNGYCTCMKAFEVGVDLNKRVEEKRQAMPDQEQPGEAETAQPVGLTADDLKEVVRETKRQKRQNAEEVKAMREDLARAICDAMISDNPAIWYQIILQYDWGIANKHKEADWETNWYAFAEEIRLEIAKKITTQLYDTQYTEPDPARALSAFNRFLKKARLPVMKSDD